MLDIDEVTEVCQNDCERSSAVCCSLCCLCAYPLQHLTVSTQLFRVWCRDVSRLSGRAIAITGV